MLPHRCRRSALPGQPSAPSLGRARSRLGGPCTSSTALQQPSTEPESSPPVTGRRIVILEPRPGEASRPLRVSGDARTFEATVTVRLERKGGVRTDTFTTATPRIDAWGHFDVLLGDGPPGFVELYVGGTRTGMGAGRSSSSSQIFESDRDGRPVVRVEGDTMSLLSLLRTMVGAACPG